MAKTPHIIVKGVGIGIGVRGERDPIGATASYRESGRVGRQREVDWGRNGGKSRETTVVLDWIVEFADIHGDHSSKDGWRSDAYIPDTLARQVHRQAT